MIFSKYAESFNDFQNYLSKNQRKSRKGVQETVYGQASQLMTIDLGC